MDRHRRYVVTVDGHVVGRLHPDETQLFDVSPGSHRCRVRIDVLRSNKVVISLEEGEIVSLTCKAAPGLAMFNTFTRPWSYLDLAVIADWKPEAQK